MADDVLYDVQSSIATITLNRPHKKNALSWSALRQFREAMVQAGDDPAARAVIVTGAGGAFCAGTDLSELNDTDTAERGGSSDGSPWMVQACSKPVVAALDGPAVGLGAEIATQADIRIFSTTARIAWNFVHRGLVPDTGAASYLLPQQIGLSAALRLLMSGEFLAANDAVECGFAMEVVEPEQLHQRAVEVATSLIQGSPMATAMVKQLVYSSFERTREAHWTANRQALAECFASEDHKEGVASFLERRAPRFTGR